MSQVKNWSLDSGIGIQACLFFHMHAANSRGHTKAFSTLKSKWPSKDLWSVYHIWDYFKTWYMAAFCGSFGPSGTGVFTTTTPEFEQKEQVSTDSRNPQECFNIFSQKAFRCKGLGTRLVRSNYLGR